MKISEIMTQKVEFVPSNTTLREAAQKMKELDCGFLAIGDKEEDKLNGVVTDRDITIRATAEGKDPAQCTVTDIKTNKVLYCFKDDEVEDAAENMNNQQVYRLIVLNNPQEKRLCGVVTLGDIVRADQITAAEKAAKGISRQHRSAA